MLVATFLALFAVFIIFFGGGTEQFGALMTQHVEDQIKIIMPENDQRKQALNELDALTKDVEALNKLIEQDMKQFTKLIEDYHSTPADFDQQLASVTVKDQEQFDKLWSGRQAMLSHIQPDEWETIITAAQAEMQKNKK